MQHTTPSGIYTEYMNRNPGAQRPFDDKFRVAAIKENPRFNEIDEKWKKAVEAMRALGTIEFPLPDNKHVRNAIIQNAAKAYFDITRELVEDLRQGIEENTLLLKDSASNKSQNTLVFEAARSYLFSLLTPADLFVAKSIHTTIEGHEKNIFFNNVLINVFQHVETGTAVAGFDRQYQNKINTYINNPPQLYPYMKMGGDSYFKLTLEEVFKADPTAFPRMIEAITREKRKESGPDKLISNDQLIDMEKLARSAQIMAWIKETDDYIVEREKKGKFTRTPFGQSKEIKLDAARSLTNALASMLSDTDRRQLERERGQPFKPVSPETLFSSENQSQLRALTHRNLGKQTTNAIAFLRQEFKPQIEERKSFRQSIRLSTARSTSMISTRLQSFRGASSGLAQTTDKVKRKEKEKEKEQEKEIQEPAPRAFEKAKRPDAKRDQNEEDSPPPSPTIGRRGK